MITAADKAAAETFVAELPTDEAAARAEYRRLDLLAETLKQEVPTPSVLADRRAVAARKAEIFRLFFAQTGGNTPVDTGGMAT